VGEKRDNIIVFYNMEFVPALKGYLKLLKNGGVYLWINIEPNSDRFLVFEK
jgi:hypothetical protein